MLNGRTAASYVSLVVLALKFGAYFLTGSVALLPTPPSSQEGAADPPRVT